MSSPEAWSLVESAFPRETTSPCEATAPSEPPAAAWSIGSALPGDSTWSSEPPAAAASSSTGSAPSAPGPGHPSDDASCPICRSPVARQALVDGCRHRFCYDCLKWWTKSSQPGHHLCPMCRQPIKLILFDWTETGGWKSETVLPVNGGGRMMRPSLAHMMMDIGNIQPMVSPMTSSPVWLPNTELLDISTAQLNASSAVKMADKMVKWHDDLMKNRWMKKKADSSAKKGEEDGSVAKNDYLSKKMEEFKKTMDDWKKKNKMMTTTMMDIGNLPMVGPVTATPSNWPSSSGRLASSNHFSFEIKPLEVIGNVQPITVKVNGPANANAASSMSSLFESTSPIDIPGQFSHAPPPPPSMWSIPSPALVGSISAAADSASSFNAAAADTLKKLNEISDNLMAEYWEVAKDSNTKPEEYKKKTAEFNKNVEERRKKRQELRKKNMDELKKMIQMKGATGDEAPFSGSKWRKLAILELKKKKKKDDDGKKGDDDDGPSAVA